MARLTRIMRKRLGQRFDMRGVNGNIIKRLTEVPGILYYLFLWSRYGFIPAPLFLKAGLLGTAFRVGISPGFSLLSQRYGTDVLQELFYEIFSCAAPVYGVAECIFIIYNDGGNTWK